MQKEGFVNGEYYHIYNRGVEERDIFEGDYDYIRFIESIKDFNSVDPAWKIEWANQKGENLEDNPLVEVVAYCLNPNHYHLLVKQLKDNGISKYFRKLGIGYTMYFNKKHERSGFLFQGTFKSSHASSEDHLKYLSAYINCNSEVHGICDAESYRWSSFKEYITGEKALCNSEIILNQFKNPSDYLSFAKENAKRMAEERKFEKMSLE